MKKQEIKKQIFEKIEIMEQNSFLFPKSWSEQIDMIDFDWSYKTYNAGYLGKSRYHTIEIYSLSSKEFEILIRGNEIQVIQNLDKKQISYNDIYYYITAIFNEKHSFKNHSEGKRKIRENIKNKLSNISSLKTEITTLRKQLSDLNKL